MKNASFNEVFFHVSPQYWQILRLVLSVRVFDCNIMSRESLVLLFGNTSFSGFRHS